MASKYVLTIVELEAVLQKVEARATIVADPYPINQYLTNAISFTDTLDFATEKALSDSAIIQEAISILLEGGHIVETVNISESSVINFGSGVSDTLNISEALLFDIDTALSDTLGVTEALSLLVFTERFPTDLVTIADVPAVLINRPAADSISVAETSIFTIDKAFSDGISIDDQSELETLSDIAKQNVFSVSESHAISVDSVLADTTSLSESAALAFSTTEADSVTMGDSSVELRLNGFLVGAESSVLNSQPFNEFSLNS